MAEGSRPPPGVAERLRQLGACYIPESDAEARARLAAERPAPAEPFAAVVARRLGELRALCQLARCLQQRTLLAEYEALLARKQQGDVRGDR
jgi:hypothetical protein